VQAQASRSDWDESGQESSGDRIVRFPRQHRQGVGGPDPTDLSAAAPRPDRRSRRQRRQAAEPESVRRYIITAGAMVLTVAVLGYLALQLGGLGKQPQPTVVTAPALSQQVAPVVQPQAAQPAQKPGQGELRTSSRAIEPSYTVAPGDTLGSIAARFGTSVEALQSINNLADRNVLSVGKKLVIPNQE
jgi:hypothetical protein